MTRAILIGVLLAQSLNSRYASLEAGTTFRTNGVYQVLGPDGNAVLDIKLSVETVAKKSFLQVLEIETLSGNHLTLRSLVNEQPESIDAYLELPGHRRIVYQAGGNASHVQEDGTRRQGRKRSVLSFDRVTLALDIGGSILPQLESEEGRALRDALPEEGRVAMEALWNVHADLCKLAACGVPEIFVDLYMGKEDLGPDNRPNEKGWTLATVKESRSKTEASSKKE